MTIPDQLKIERGDHIGPIRFMTAASNYVMVRRPGCMPWVEPLKAWLRRPLERDAVKYRAAFAKALAK